MAQVAARHLRALPGYFNPVSPGGIDGQYCGCSDYGQAFFYSYAHDVFLGPAKETT
jgi:hypothetical protein